MVASGSYWDPENNNYCTVLLFGNTVRTCVLSARSSSTNRRSTTVGSWARWRGAGRGFGPCQSQSSVED